MKFPLNQPLAEKKALNEFCFRIEEKNTTVNLGCGCCGLEDIEYAIELYCWYYVECTQPNTYLYLGLRPIAASGPEIGVADCQPHQTPNELNSSSRI
jgi:hypothetical protein